MSRFSPTLRLAHRLLARGAASLLVGAGCATNQLSTIDLPGRSGLIVMLPGVEGGAWQLAELRAGLSDGGVADEIRAINWGIRPLGSLANLMDIDANRRRAAAIAGEIAEIHRRNPDSPIHLLGYSGGGGLALLIAEALPQDVVLERIILIAPAVSPTFDLTTALRRTRHGIVHFYSVQDRTVLGAGTRTLGTIDRVKCDAAGMVGFQNAAGDLREVPGLLQIAWTPLWRSLGHMGGHVGWLARPWATQVLAPILKKP